MVALFKPVACMPESWRFAKLPMRRALLASMILFLASPALAAGAGKAGLWTMSTTWQFAPSVVPSALVALARQQGNAPPRNGQPFTHHMCMTAYEADGRQPPHFN